MELNKREKIIVGLMVLAIFYFVYIFFLAGDKRKEAPTASSSPTLTLKIAEELRGELREGAFDPPPSAAFLAALESGWREESFVAADFFLPDQAALELQAQEATMNAAEVEAAASELVYSGFLELDSRRLAVINGSEYLVGDQVGNGLVLERINPYSLLLSRDGHSVMLPIIDLDTGAKVTKP